MRMLTGIREFEPMTRMVAVADLSAGKYYADETFPRGGQIPNSILFEIIAQAAALFLAASHDFRIKAVPIVLNRVSFRLPLHPGTRFTVEVQLVSMADHVALMRAMGGSEDAHVVEAEFVMGFGSDEGTWALPIQPELLEFYFESIFERDGRAASPGPPLARIAGRIEAPAVSPVARVEPGH